MQKMTKERLVRYHAMKRENANRMEKLHQMQADAQMPAPKDPDGAMPTGSSGERMARAVEAYLEYEEQIRPVIEANRQEMATIEAAVEALLDPMEREVLRLRYLEGEYCHMMPWAHVSAKLYGQDDEKHLLATYRVHRRALKNIEATAKG